MKSKKIVFKIIPLKRVGSFSINHVVKFDAKPTLKGGL